MKITIPDTGNRVAALPRGTNVPREAFVQDGGGFTRSLQSVAAAAVREEREQAMKVEQENARVSTMLAQGKVQNGLASLRHEITNGISDGSLHRQDAETLWTKRAGKIISEGIADASPDHLDALQAQAVTMSDRMLLDVRQAVIKRGEQEIAGGLMQYGELMQRYAEADVQQATSQYHMAVDSMGPKAGMTPVQIQTAKQSFSERVWTTRFGAQILAAKNDPLALDRIEAEIAANPVLDPEKKSVLTSRAMTAKQSAWAATASDLEIAVRRGRAGYADIEGAMKAGIITPAKRTELTLTIDAANRRQADAEAAERSQIARVHAAIEGRGMFLDFRAKEDRNAVDVYYGKVFQPSIERAGLDPLQAMQEAVGFAARAGIVPTPMRAVIRGALRSGDSNEPGQLGVFHRVSKAQAADLLDRLKTANPALLDDFSAEDIALGNTIQSYVKAGVPAIQAVGLAEKSLSVPEAEREARKTRYTAEKAPAKNLKRLEKELTGFRWFSPNMPGRVPDALAGEYERLTREEFVRSGELEAAQSTALDHLRRVWGVTRIDGKPRWMKYAPETVYSVPGEDGAWIREQLQAELTKNALFDGKPELTLAADSLTAREDAPSYVVLQRKAGVLESLLGSDGMPLRFRPDYTTSPAGERRQQAIEAEREKATRILSAPPDPGPSNVFNLNPAGAAVAPLPRKRRAR